ncbi:SDR family NAD(P)-dependent oxidoreductase [Ehrlichia canis]|uniref:SDR family NAD(P)-dependent oxidoreductase n=1 Tax=Ehrlichia canis TaxID=944 RepID=UPI000C84E717|nr:SDR family NAD(P)-dependent oxidoreductase [Ehrlichia canis]AUO54437.1 pteridine reductase [Ehrlichia canis]UKC53496.1 SDR family NAD(P)-dependent oxidoreductase [Ehrlichia canis]UKC54435.1 SDR family NAD(P)-dependent oxidoreductase [Ehrlichia canis]UKC55371.1 SDR family NAD(P)-dependent oxidoreductase [Ehrlichia canis]
MSQTVYKGALITGGARRLGKAIAMFLADNGYDIAIHYNTSESQALKTKDIIENLYNRKCILIQADLTEFNSLNLIIDETFQFMPYCNCLINNASVFYKNTLMNTSIQDFSYNYDLHIKAPLFLTQYFAKKCITIGNIINIIDAIVIKNATKSFTYTMSKKSLLDLTKFAAVELSPNIKVNAIGPRMIPGDFLDNINHKNIMDNAEVKYILTTIEKLLAPNNQETGTTIIMP